MTPRQELKKIKKLIYNEYEFNANLITYLIDREYLCDGHKLELKDKLGEWAKEIDDIYLIKNKKIRRHELTANQIAIMAKIEMLEDLMINIYGKILESQNEKI